MAVQQASDQKTGPIGKVSLRRWIEPWYVAYALLGISGAGMAPILLPLVVNKASSASMVGLVMAALSLGGLTAPLWGGLADKNRLHRWLLAGGLLVTALGLLFFAFADGFVAWVGLALVQGAGMAAAATVANLFIVENHPKEEWDDRIGWLQTFYGGGQVIGLLLAGYFSQGSLQIGLLAAALLVAVAVLPGWLTTHVSETALRPRPVLLHPAKHGDWSISSPQRLFHHLTRQSLTQIKQAVLSPFGLFLAAWVLSFGGTAAVFSLYPVLMERVFGISPGYSSIGFAVSAGLGLAFYSPAGRWAQGYSAARVFQAGMLMRLVALLSMLALGLVHPGGLRWLGLVCFLVIVLAWSLLSVAGTAVTAELSPIGEGEGIGIFNAATAVAGVLGAVLGGWAAGVWGYQAVAGLGAAGVLLGLLVSLAVFKLHSRPGPLG
jgi:MFS transporter, DHA1 family, tetracycline resistance protein